VQIARLWSVRRILVAVHADGHPPLYHLLASACLRLFGDNPIAPRLPAMVAFAAAALAVYLYVRRRCGPVFGMLAMLALACCGNATFGAEARPYALELGFAGLTLVSRQIAAERERSRLLPLLGVTLGIVGAVARPLLRRHPGRRAAPVR
jgi:4-amino-4-deoxy-L-arabinose transferase-like glycosyltransferase